MMTKAQTIEALKNAYRVGNASDGRTEEAVEGEYGRQSWTTPKMASEFCTALDMTFQSLVTCGVLTSEELQEIYDTL